MPKKRDARAGRWNVDSSKNRTAENRKACNSARREANKLMSDAHATHFRQRIDGALGPRQKWKTANELLHMRDRSESYTDDECRKMSDGLGDYFIQKVKNIKSKIADQLRSRTSSSVSDFGRSANGRTFDDLVSVSADDVKKIISSMPSKSSPVMYYQPAF